MKNVVVTDDNIIAAEIIALFLESFFDCNVISVKSVSEAITAVEQNDPLELIVSDYDMPTQTGGDFYKWCIQNSKSIPFLLITSNELDELPEFDFSADPNLHYLQKPFDSDEMMNCFKEIFASKKEVSESCYIGIKIDQFLKFKSNIFPIHIKLSDDKIVKIANVGEDISLEQILRYQEKGLDKFYLLASDFHQYTDSLLSNISEKLESSATSAEEKIDLQFSSVDLLCDQLVRFGASEAALRVAKISVNATLSNIKSNKSLGSLLQEILSGKGYRNQLALMAGYVAAALAQKTDWADQKSVEKLVYASYFQDVALSDPELAKMNDLKSEEFLSLVPQQQKEIQDHVFKAIEILDKIDPLSSDIKNIITQHHELPDGSGFPRGLNHLNTAPLSCVFIIAYRFSDHILKEGVSKDSLVKIILDLKNNFNRGNYKKPLMAFFEVYKNLGKAN